VTSKGQVTLPVALRRRLDIHTGDDLEFEETTDGAVVRVVHRRGLTEFLGALKTTREVADHDEERRIAARALGQRRR